MIVVLLSTNVQRDKKRVQAPAFGSRAGKSWHHSFAASLERCAALYLTYRCNVFCLIGSQVDYAHEQLEELHPLAHTDIREAFPWVGLATCYKKSPGQSDDYTVPDGNVKKEKGTLKINGKDIKKKEVKKKKNPIKGGDVVETNAIAQLGFGIVAYVNILWMLIWTFTVYTLLLLPTMFSYSDGTAYSAVPEAVKSSYLDSYLGNLGYSSVQCASIPSKVGQLNIDCPYGKIGKFLDYGINPLVKNKNICVNDSSNEGCYPDSDYVKTELESSIGLSEKLFTFNGVSSLFKDGTGSPECNTEESTLFVQYTCEQTEATMSEKYN